jgi:hypothetical protein
MVNSPNDIGRNAPAANVLGVGGGPQRAGASGGHSARPGGSPIRATPNGPRGMRMLSPDTPLSALDRSSPRGTYLDILV